MSVLSSSQNINKGCSKQELAHHSKYSFRTESENVVEMIDRQRRKFQQKENKRAALEKKQAQIDKDKRANVFAENTSAERETHYKKKTFTKDKSISQGIKASIMNPKDPESSSSEDDDSLIDESEEPLEKSSRYFQEVTQESKDLYSNIRSEGQVIKVLEIKSLGGAPKGMYELQGECESVLSGFEVIGEIGKGFHGKVLKLRKDSEKDRVIKLYSKEDEKEFLVEASILANLRRITAGGIGISTFIKTTNFYGIIMLAGVGTLGNFRDFMREENISLTERELSAIHMGLMRNYAAIRQTSVFHRDIKLDNVIIHSRNLNLEIIDYSFAVFADPNRKYSGYAGTPGFIAPHIKNAEEEYGDQRLLEGDLFSIGITVLCMADLSFKLTQHQILKRAKKSLKKISSKKQLCRTLKSLILDCRDSTEKQAKSMFPNYNLGYFSGLSKYQDRFESYLEKKECQSLSRHFENKIDGFGMQKPKEYEREQKIAAENFRIGNERFKARSCYELIMKSYLVSGDLDEAKPFFYEINSEIMSSKPIYCSPLVYSTLGVYLYLAKDPEAAKNMFKMGLKQCKEEFETLILLNNFAYACDFRGYSALNSSQRAYDLVIRCPASLKNIAIFVQVWLQSSQCHQQRVVAILNEGNNERKYELLLTLHQPIRSLKRDSFDRELCASSSLRKQGVLNKTFEKDELIFLTFLNFCQSKASVIASKLEIINKELLEEIKEFCSSLKQEYYFQIAFQPDFGVLSTILLFHDLLLSHENHSNELKELYEEVYTFEKYKNEIYRLIDKRAQEEFFEKFLTSELSIALIGFITKFSESTILTKAGVRHIQKKTNALLKFTDTIEMSVRKKKVDPLFCSYDSLFKELFHLNPSLSSQTEELELLQRINSFLSELKFRIYSDPSNKPQWKLFYLSLLVSERLFEIPKLPVIPSSITSLEDLKLYVKQGSTFDEKGEVLYQVLATKFLLNLEMEFIQDNEKKLHFHNDSAKHAIEFICSFKRLEKMRIKIFDGHLTSEGMKYFEKIGKELKSLKSLTISFQSCPYITDSSIRSLIQAVDTFSELEHFTLELQICANVSIEEVAQYKSEMKGHLKERANIIVEPTIDFSYTEAS